MLRTCLFFSLITGCGALDPNSDVPEYSMSQASSFNIEVERAVVRGAQVLDVAIDLANAPPNGATPSDCMRAHSSLTISANGTQGTITSYGGIDTGPLGTEDSCNAVVGIVPFSPLPATADIVLADETGQLHVAIATDPMGNYEVTHCDAAQCSAY
jgi:hypothetical protein